MATAPSRSRNTQASMQFIFARGRWRPAAPAVRASADFVADSGGRIAAREWDQQASEGQDFDGRAGTTREFVHLTSSGAMCVTYVNHVNCGRRLRPISPTVVLYLMLRDGDRR